MNMKWQPIEAAPKDGTNILLYRPTAYSWAQVTVGSYDPNNFAKKNPRPYWQVMLSRIGVAEQRSWEPTHWMPLPEPPTQDSE